MSTTAEPISRIDGPSGSCDGCPAAGLTLTSRFETALRELVPDLVAVRSVEPEPVASGRRHLGLLPLRRR